MCSCSTPFGHLQITNMTITPLMPVQVRSSLFSNLMSSLAGSADPQVLSAMVALGDVSSSSGTEQWVAQYANQYL